MQRLVFLSHQILDTERLNNLANRRFSIFCYKNTVEIIHRVIVNKRDENGVCNAFLLGLFSFKIELLHKDCLLKYICETNSFNTVSTSQYTHTIYHFDKTHVSSFRSFFFFFFQSHNTRTHIYPPPTSPSFSSPTWFF